MPERVDAMIRHVVVFTWEDVGGMTSLVVADDAGLVDGNADTVLIADFPDVDAFRRYAQDPVHLSVLAEHVRPWLAGRSAVQYEI